MKIADSLVDWFARQARTLPWRTEPRDPYRTLVSEIMLQQTQVDRVVPKFVEFVDKFPDLQSLASASEDDVLSVWSGLGYYRRARLLHRLAGQLIERGRTRLPEDFDALLALPGIGDYTAAAVCSLAFGLKEPVLDGNVRRVIARMLAVEGDSRNSKTEKMMKAWVSDLFQDHHPGVVNEALMELGAIVCTPSQPRCEDCPTAEWCRGRHLGRPTDFPAARKVRAVENLRWVAACIVGPDNRWLLQKIEHGPILRGLWLPPLADLVTGSGADDVAAALAPSRLELVGGVEFEPVRHHITHRRIDVVPVLLEVPWTRSEELGDAMIPREDADFSAATWQWCRPEGFDKGTSSLLKKLFKAINCSK